MNFTTPQVSSGAARRGVRDFAHYQGWGEGVCVQEEDVLCEIISHNNSQSSLFSTISLVAFSLFINNNDS